MKEIKNTILYCVFVRILVIVFYYNSGTLINYSSGSDILTSYGSYESGSTTLQKRLEKFTWGGPACWGSPPAWPPVKPALQEAALQNPRPDSCCNKQNKSQDIYPH